MSLFQCSECGCVENTACCRYHYNRAYKVRGDRDLCSSCDPTLKQWHGKFGRVYLAPGAFKTNERGNLEHIESGVEWHRPEVQEDNDGFS